MAAQATQFYCDMDGGVTEGLVSEITQYRKLPRTSSAVASTSQLPLYATSTAAPISAKMSNTQLFSKMFGLGRQSRDIITLFHKPSSKASIRVHNMLKQTAATASETATEDQASDHTAQDKLQRTEFDLEVVEAPPTGDQLKTMMEYAGGKNPGSFITGATSITDALKRLKDGGDVFNRPVVVDWTNGRVVAGENESELVKMLRSSTPKEP